MPRPDLFLSLTASNARPLGQRLIQQLWTISPASYRLPPFRWPVAKFHSVRSWTRLASPCALHRLGMPLFVVRYIKRFSKAFTFAFSTFRFRLLLLRRACAHCSLAVSRYCRCISMAASNESSTNSLTHSNGRGRRSISFCDGTGWSALPVMMPAYEEVKHQGGDQKPNNSYYNYGPDREMVVL